jgi:hypothetical protein
MDNHHHRQAQPPEHHRGAPEEPLQLLHYNDHPGVGRRESPPKPRRRTPRCPHPCSSVHTSTPVPSTTSKLWSRRQSLAEGGASEGAPDNAVEETAPTVPALPNTPTRMSHLTGPWLSISPTMGPTALRRGQHHAPPLGRRRHTWHSFPTQKARAGLPCGNLVDLPLATAATDLPPTAAEVPPLHGRRLPSTEAGRMMGGCHRPPCRHHEVDGREDAGAPNRRATLCHRWEMPRHRSQRKSSTRAYQVAG